MIAASARVFIEGCVKFGAIEAAPTLTLAIRTRSAAKLSDMAAANVLKPTEKTYRLLYAKSGNRCAFPRCTTSITHGGTLVGEAAHIRAESPGGPRYDASQTAEERRSYANLLLLCGVHHKVVDDDEVAYTVERLKQMKATHESTATTVQEDSGEAVTAAQLLIAGDGNFAGGILNNNITAGQIHQTVNNHYGATQARDTGVVETYKGLAPRQGHGRFREQGKPLGRHESADPLAQEHLDVHLMDGPAFWFRLWPLGQPTKTWTVRELEDAAGEGRTFDLFTIRGAADYRLSYKDGIGRYKKLPNYITYAVAFLFKTGEIWYVDTELVGCPLQQMYFAVNSARTQLPVLLNKYSQILNRLGIPGPYRWQAGVEGVSGCFLGYSVSGQVLSRQLRLDVDLVVQDGLYTHGKDDAQECLDSFFRKLFEECGADMPDNLER